jgi:succinate dehydrogenase / fumarate reductase cytochrome b subunit
VGPDRLPRGLLALGLHVYHGIWSTTQTLAVRSAFVRKWRRPVSAALATGLIAGYLLVPAAVLFGWLRLP